MSRPPPKLEDLDFTELLGDPRPAPEPAPATDDMMREGVIGEKSLGANGFHVVISRARGAPRAGKATILVVEDHDDTAALAVRALENAGFATMRAASAQETGHLLATLGVPALILLDVELPGLSGFDMLGKLRKHPKLHSIPIVMFTGRASREDVVRGLTLGADGYVVKPVKPATLVEVVNQVLGR